MRHFVSFCLLFCVAALVSSGCKQETKTTGDGNVAGTYVLMNVDGKKVPCDIQHDGHAVAIKSGAFVINADGTCSSKMVFAPPSGSEASREVKATYTRQGPTLTMKWEGAGTTTGTVQGNQFTMNNEGMILVYQK